MEIENGAEHSVEAVHCLRVGRSRLKSLDRRDEREAPDEVLEVVASDEDLAVGNDARGPVALGLRHLTVPIPGASPSWRES